MTTSISSASTGSITTQGVGSGVDIASIVDKLVSVESAPLNRLKSRESAYQTKVSAFGAARGVLSSFQNAVKSLSNPTAFSSFAASINDSSIASIAIDPTKTSTLSAGSHTLRVDTLASSQRTAAAGVADTSSVIGTGTITIDVGSWNSGYTSFTPNTTAGSKTITIDAGNDSLLGIRDAINQAGAGVTASIVNDGSGNRLVLASASTGSANGFRISTADSDGANLDTAGLSQLAFDPAAAGGTPQTQHVADATNASFSLDGLTISKAGNHVTDAIDGLNIDLAKVSTTATAFTIARDTTTAKSNVKSFVAAYNSLVGTLGQLTNYNATSKTAGVLNGDSSIRLITTQLQKLVASVVPTGGSLTTLNDVGIKFNGDGTLTADDTKLTAALASDPDSVGKLFATTATASDSLVSYTGSTIKTQEGSHPLTVSQLATHGGVTASNAAGLTINAGVNDTFSITVDNILVTVVVPPATYADANALASALQGQINGTSALSTQGSSVSVTQSAGVLAISSQRYGSGSSVLIGDGNGVAGLFGTTPTGNAGLDVAGTLDGIAFTGQGQLATGAATTSAEGLKLTIGGGLTGNRGNVGFNRGIAGNLDGALTQYLDTTNGLVTAATDGLNKSITDLQSQEDAWSTRLVAIRARLTAQYNAMDALVASLNSTSSYLTQQLDALKKSTSNSN